MAEVFRGLLPAFFAAAYRTSVCSADAFRQLTGLLHLWRDRGIYPAAFVQDVEAQMLAIVRCCHPSAQPGPWSPFAELVGARLLTPAVAHREGLTPVHTNVYSGSRLVIRVCVTVAG